MTFHLRHFSKTRAFQTAKNGRWRQKQSNQQTMLSVTTHTFDASQYRAEKECCLHTRLAPFAAGGGKLRTAQLLADPTSACRQKEVFNLIFFHPPLASVCTHLQLVRLP
jgi:hypothetical protein